LREREREREGGERRREREREGERLEQSNGILKHQSLCNNQ
jgi:hypothetical protein